MNHTIFDNPLISPLMGSFASFLLKSLGWRTAGEIPDAPKFVLIAAPHTSNWDFVFTLLMAFSMKLKIHMMGKEELLRWPLGVLFRWLGVIAVDRSRPNGTVDRMVEAFRGNRRLILVVPPAGTRKKVLRWKSGFYHIARGAGVPIVLGYLDYRRKIGGIGPVVQPTGDAEKDMGTIKAFYADIDGKYPEKSLSAAAPVMSTQ